MKAKIKKISICLFILFLVNTSIGASTNNETKDTETTTVYVTKSGSCYHKRSCSTLSRSKNLTPLTKEVAKSKGYRACSKCNP